MANGWLTDTLILLPLGGAIFIALAPLPRLAAGLVALVVSLFEIAFWGGALSAFDYGAGGEQHPARRTRPPGSASSGSRTTSASPASRSGWSA